MPVRPLHADCWIFGNLSRSGRHFQRSTNPSFFCSFSKYLLSPYWARYRSRLLGSSSEENQDPYFCVA